MAKHHKKWLALFMALALCVAQMATPVIAVGADDPVPSISGDPAPVNEHPPEEPVAEQPPVDEPPVEEPPVEEPPAEEPPVEEPPAEEPPAEEPPAEEPPVEEPPAEEPPAEEPPAEEPPSRPQYSRNVEWYEVYVQGSLVASGTGRYNDAFFLGTHYVASATVTGSTLNWSIVPQGMSSSGSFRGSVDLTRYITIPEGFTVKDIQIEESSITGVNDPYYDMYDNAIIRITIKTLYNEQTQEEIEIPENPPVDYDPVLTVTKTADQDAYLVGETVKWTITVTNASEFDALNVLLQDPVTGDSWQLGKVEAGQSVSRTVETVPEAAGTVANTAVVTWEDGDEVDDDDNNTARDEETVTVTEPDYEPVITVKKVAEKASYLVGENVKWTIIVTNESEFDAYNVLIRDDRADQRWMVEILPAGRQISFAVETVAQKAGTLENLVVVSWEDGDNIEDDEDNTASAEETVTVEEPDYAPVLTVKKTAEKASYLPGETVKWTITVSNTSEFDAYNVLITDQRAGEEWTLDVLAAGEEVSYTVELVAEAAGTFENVAVVTWEDGDNIDDDEDNTDSDAETVVITEPPAPEDFAPFLSVLKTAEKGVYLEGETIRWSITVANDTEYDAYNVLITDRRAGEEWMLEVLPAGEKVSYTVEMVAEAAGTVENVAVVTWEDGDELEDDENNWAQDEESVTVSPPPAPPAQPDPTPQPDPDPTPIQPRTNEPPVTTAPPSNDEDQELVVIEDEDVPLADVPETGDASILWAAMSALSAGGFFALNRKRKEK